MAKPVQKNRANLQHFYWHFSGNYIAEISRCVVAAYSEKRYSGVLFHCTLSYAGVLMEASLIHRVVGSWKGDTGRKYSVKLSPSQSAWQCGSSMAVHINDIDHIVVFRIGGLKAGIS